MPGSSLKHLDVGPNLWQTVHKWCAQTVFPKVLLLVGGHHLLLDPRLLMKLLLWIIPASLMQLVVLHHCSGLLLMLLWRSFSFILKPLLCSGVSLNHCCWACFCQHSSLYSLSSDVSLYHCYWVNRVYELFEILCYSSIHFLCCWFGTGITKYALINIATVQLL